MGRKPARQSVAAVYDRRTPFPRQKAATTPSELADPLAKTQGSSMLATQGCRMESRWDSPLEFVGNDQVTAATLHSTATEILECTSAAFQDSSRIEIGRLEQGLPRTICRIPRVGSATTAAVVSASSLW